ncbi:MAG: PaaI family thioesterase [Desulfobulbia bacterium]
MQNDALPTELATSIRNRVSKIPIVDTLALEILSLAKGYCAVRVPRDDKYDVVFESFHGGLLMTVADSTACFAIFTETGPDVRLTTTDMNIRFLAPCFSDVTAEARVIKAGKTLCPVAIDLYDTKRTHIAVAQVTYILLGAMDAVSRT